MKPLLMFLVLLFATQLGCTPKMVEMGSTIPSREKTLPSTYGQEEEKRAGKAMEESEGMKAGVKEEEIKIASRERGQVPSATGAPPLRDIHFDFDSYTIRSEDTRVLKEIGSWLRENKNARLLIEGHCDERGTVDYNLILGQKRADAVKAYLVGLGVEENRVRTISYGKERPLDPRHTEEAWAKNRRAHFEIER